MEQNSWEENKKPASQWRGEAVFNDGVGKMTIFGENKNCCKLKLLPTLQSSSWPRNTSRVRAIIDSFRVRVHVGPMTWLSRHISFRKLNSSWVYMGLFLFCTHSQKSVATKIMSLYFRGTAPMTGFEEEKRKSRGDTFFRSCALFRQKVKLVSFSFPHSAIIFYLFLFLSSDLPLFLYLLLAPGQFCLFLPAFHWMLA